MDYDPTEFSSIQAAARARANAEREFGMPRKPYPDTEFGRLVNQEHFRRDDAINREFGGRATRADLRRKWNC